MKTTIQRLHKIQEARQLLLRAWDLIDDAVEGMPIPIEDVTGLEKQAKRYPHGFTLTEWVEMEITSHLDALSGKQNSHFHHHTLAELEGIVRNTGSIKRSTKRAA